MRKVTELDCLFCTYRGKILGQNEFDCEYKEGEFCKIEPTGQLELFELKEEM